jgi:hypothetical protein
MKLTGHKTEAVYRRNAIADAKALEEVAVRMGDARSMRSEGHVFRRE